jgi:hypothetical protein
MEDWVWIGIAFCISQSAMFSGLNLAFFGLSRLRLEVEAQTNPKAARILRMRTDSNFLLTTILWGNVGINVLVALLADSVMTGVAAFLFSTVLITFIGEIFPQAYFSRNAMQMASLLGPVLRFYQFLLYPVAKPSALMLDAWLGKESPEFYREKVIRDILLRHVEDDDTDVAVVEGVGAANFLEIDDAAVTQEGSAVDPASVIALPCDVDLPRFPDYEPIATDPFLQRVQASKRKWVILTDPEGKPQVILDADGFLRAALLESEHTNPYAYCHRPIVITSNETKLGSVIHQLARSKVHPSGVIENDVVLLWTDVRQIITGADLFDRLLHGMR